ncbi:2,3-diaminopropionate biosynthesis protein SbnB [Cohnella soli]|uniref:2,3-diaminopropionate biosynthesis protein SbnB n=1 Tax=Cohnella soli TaxID=425005 RepID=A0ABW0HVK7_9BACL
MRYFNEKDVLALGADWNNLIDAMEKAIICQSRGEAEQPLKPYLKFRNTRNRIIAMPAYVGGTIKAAGIKWIASFPDNIERGLSRASSLLVLNDVSTGKPLAIFNTTLLSILRTVSVTGVMLRSYLNSRTVEEACVGILGVGPIGQWHYKFLKQMYGDKIKRFIVFDKSQARMNEFIEQYQDKTIRLADSWESAYCQSDMVITCTTTSEPYINLPPKPGSLQLNISLRDYSEGIYPYVTGGIVIDNWSEVCREGTSIELLYKRHGLKPTDCMTLEDIILRNKLSQVNSKTPIFFSPMGMAIFDVTIGKYYLTLAEESGTGLMLEG